MQASAFTDQVVCALGEESQTRPTRLERIVEELKTRQDQDEVLDPLTLLAHLVPSPDAGADALLEVIRERCSPKEVIVACEELLEGLSRRVEEGKGEEEISLMCQVLRLVRLFTVIARSPRGSRRRKVSNMIHSFVPELGLVIRMVCESEGENTESACDLLSACADLVEGIIGCLDDEEKETCKNILLPFLISTTTSLSPFIPSSLSHRVFARCFPRLSTTVAPEKRKRKTEESGTEVMQRLVEVYTRLGGRWDDSFVLWAHAVVMGLDKEHRHAPVILAAIRGSAFLDEALAVLLVFFSSHSPHPPPPPPPPPLSYSSPLLTLLPTLASAHPDPFIRLCAFRLFSLVLRATPGVLQIQVLVDLLSGDQHHQHHQHQHHQHHHQHHHHNNNNNNNNPHSKMLRVAAVGLVKDLVLDALSVSGGNNILASPAFVISLAPVLFTPPELVLDSSFSMNTIPPNYTISPDDSVLDPTSPNTDEALEVELTKLGHVLALYYALEKTDVANRTGIRDPDNRANIERTLIAPIRSAVSRWALQPDIPPSPSPQGTRVRAALVALQMGVERIDEMWRARGLGCGV
ncbi:hypothetical protein F5051DRAFT_423329 [Lentinula edodes]|nr:hypothetical protein F5051DRAFT_423329 [Lentinula edodes]